MRFPIGQHEHRLDILRIHGLQRIGNHGVSTLSLELAASRVNEIGRRFEGEADDDLIRAGHLLQSQEQVRHRTELQFNRIGPSPKLRPRRLGFRAIVGDSRGHEENIMGWPLLMQTGFQFMRGAEPDEPHVRMMRGAIGADRPQQQGGREAVIQRCTGQFTAHAA